MEPFDIGALVISLTLLFHAASFLAWNLPKTPSNTVPRHLVYSGASAPAFADPSGRGETGRLLLLLRIDL